MKFKITNTGSTPIVLQTQNKASSQSDVDPKSNVNEVTVAPGAQHDVDSATRVTVRDGAGADSDAKAPMSNA